MGYLNLKGIGSKYRFLLLILLVCSVAYGAKYFEEVIATKLDVDNIRVDANTISTTNTNGNLTLDMNGTGSVILTDLTASRALVLDSSKKITASATTDTQIGYLSTLSSNAQTQIDGKQATGNYITALTGDVTASGPGSVASTIGTNKVTDTMIRQSGALSVIGRSANSTGNVADISAGTDHFALRRSGTSLAFGLLTNNNIDTAAAIAVSKLAALTASRALVSDASGLISVSATTSTQIGYLSTLASDVQTQINTLNAFPIARASGTPAAATDGNPIIFGTEAFDTDSAYDPTTGRFTVPTGKGGYYRVTFMSDATTNSLLYKIYVDAAAGPSICVTPTLNPQCSGSNVVNVSPTQIIDVRPSGAGTGNWSSRGSVVFEKIRDS